MYLNSKFKFNYNNNLIKLFIKKLQKSGKLKKAEKIFNKILLNVKIKSNKEPLILIEKTILNLATPIVIKKKKIGGSIYFIPTPINLGKAISIGISWLLNSVKSLNDLSNEIIYTANLQGTALKKKQLYIKNTISNRVFSHISLLNYSKFTQYNKNIYIEESIINTKLSNYLFNNKDN